MRIIRRTQQQKTLAALALLGIPVFVLNLWVMQKGSIAKTFELEKLRWIGVQSFLILIVAQSILNVRWRGFWLFLLICLIVLGGNIYFLIVLKNYALAFYAMFLLIISVLYSLNLYKSFYEPYYRPGLAWYEGKPRLMPKIEAVVCAGEKRVLAGLSQLGREGCYAYPIGSDRIAMADAILLKLNELRLECAVELISESRDGFGRGLRFVLPPAAADRQKDINDFIDRVRSFGYVA